jgi:hypothetical protein
MKTGIRAILTGAFLVISLLLLGTFNLTKARILVLHSFDQNAPSVGTMDEGIRQTLNRNRQPISVRWHYLGMDHLPDEDHRQGAAAQGRRTIEQFDPDLIIAVDDEAQEYVARRYAGRSRPKVVFAAIDRNPKDYGYIGAPNVTGIVEALPLAAIRDTLLQARQGQAARLAVLSHPGPTGMGRARQVEAFNWAPHRIVAVHLLPDFAGWQAAITAMAGKVDVILLLSYDGLETSPAVTNPVPRAEVIEWIKTNAMPLPVGTSVSYVQEGGGLSVVPSPLEMGEVAAAYALSWLKARSTDQPPPIIQSTQYRIAIRASELHTRNITLPSIYIGAARLDQLYYP